MTIFGKGKDNPEKVNQESNGVETSMYGIVDMDLPESNSTDGAPGPKVKGAAALYMEEMEAKEKRISTSSQESFNNFGNLDRVEEAKAELANDKDDSDMKIFKRDEDEEEKVTIYTPSQLRE